jgi:hypothetical protein
MELPFAYISFYRRLFTNNDSFRQYHSQQRQTQNKEPMNAHVIIISHSPYFLLDRYSSTSRQINLNGKMKSIRDIYLIELIEPLALDERFIAPFL